MSLLRFIILPVLLTLPSLAFGAETKRLHAAPAITAVTVYPDQAMTIRTATLSLKPGSYVVVFDNLPALLKDDSVRVEGKGTATAAIAGLEVKRVFLDQSGEKRVKDIEEEIHNLERRSGLLDARKTGLIAQRGFLDSIRVAWGDRISKELAVGRPTSAELMDASSFVGAGVTKAEEQIRSVDTEKQQIKDRIDALKRQRNQTSGSHKRENKTIEVEIEVTGEGDLTLALTSLIPQAGWEPAYDVRLAPDGKTAELTFKAQIRQNTGEDWKDVNLNLSTARPAAGGAPPELNPWHVSLFRPLPAAPAESIVMSAPAPARAKAKRAQMEADKAEEYSAKEGAAPAANLTSQIIGEQTSTSFHIPRAADIPSDGTQHSNVVTVEKLPVSLEYVAIPKLSPHVFLKSELVNQAAYPFLPGRINIFTGTTFTGSSQLKKVAAGEKFDLFFGTDDQMTVKRDELKQHHEAGSFGKNRMTYNYRIAVANFKPDAYTVTVLDQLPLAGDSEIKVSLEEPSIKPDEVKDDGKLTWKLPLKAGEKKEITFGIIVEYPKEIEITGL